MNLTASQVLNSPERIVLFAQVFVGGAAIGLVLGLLPYFIGRKRGNRKLGILALPACVVSGLLLGAVLTLPVAVAFSIAILTSEDPAWSRLLKESMKADPDVLYQIVKDGTDQADEDVTENPAPEEQTASMPEESSESHRPLVEKLFS